MYTRDDLVQALRVAAQFLEGLPESLTLAPSTSAAATFPASPPVDGAVVTGPRLSGDGAIVYAIRS